MVGFHAAKVFFGIGISVRKGDKSKVKGAFGAFFVAYKENDSYEFLQTIFSKSNGISYHVLRKL